MRRPTLVLVGSCLLAAGVVFTLQGIGVIGGSFMSGSALWAVLGPCIAFGGLLLVAAGRRR